MKIMIVDDCNTTRKLLGHYLRSRGYSVVFAENGIDALEKLAIHDVHLVMTDLNMPYMDGIELIKELRSDPELSEIPILMITTENDDREREMAISSGANAYMVKPVTGNAIEENIKSIVKQIFTKGG
jgi:two-component system chemotaxis response regulator CheY